MYAFKVGDRVAIYTSHGNSLRKNCAETVNLASIAKVLKNYVVLSDGTKWNLRGYPWGNKNIWSFSQIKPVTAEEIAKIRERQALANKQRKIIAHINEWERTDARVSPDIVNTVYNLLFPPNG